VKICYPVLREKSNEIQPTDWVFALGWREDGAKCMVMLARIQISSTGRKSLQTCNQYKMFVIERSIGQRRVRPVS
jgi:hypothetical protein